MSAYKNMGKENKIAGFDVEFLPTSGDTDFNHTPVRVMGDRVISYGTFSDQELRVALELGHIVCDPEPRKINGSSIDVTLGHYFYHAGTARKIDGIFNPFDKEDVDRYFGKPKKALPLDIVREKITREIRERMEAGLLTKYEGTERLERFENLEYLHGIPDDHPLVILRPGERILAHTNEFIGIKPPGTTSMQSRSTTGRIGVAACFCAGWGDPGYINRWTMEVNNLNENEYVPIPVGFRMAQIVFSMTGPVDIEYAKATGKYQPTSSNDLTEIKRLWTPEQMLPHAYKDEIVLPPVPEGLNPDYI
ncbi:MAG TPA: deoxycytidine triphosphate deaminase [Candidatus Bathyarchaeia archaeon]|nr:deoxycytidine triphosphate deaminase [Candidatus Bathyarchaeia archaeon]